MKFQFLIKVGLIMMEKKLLSKMHLLPCTVYLSTDFLINFFHKKKFYIHEDFKQYLKVITLNFIN